MFYENTVQQLKLKRFRKSSKSPIIPKYSSLCGSSNGQPVMSLNPEYVVRNGGTNIFGDGQRMTTTDALQIQGRYCKDAVF